MPNYCHNDIKISGDPLDIKELHDRISLFLKHNSDGYWAATYYTMFRTMQPRFIEHSDLKKRDELNKDFDVYREYGSKWWDIYDLDFNEEEGTLYISSDSAWSPVLTLCEKLALDYNLKITCKFSEPGMNFAGEYTYNASGCIKQEDYTYQEYAYKDDKEYFIEDCINSADCFYSVKEFEKGYQEIFELLKTKYDDTETIQKIKEGVKGYMEDLNTSGET